MKRLSCLLALALALSVAWASEAVADSPEPTITSDEAATFLALLSSGGRESVDFAPFERSRQGSLKPIIVTTGVHCVLPSRSESYHAVWYSVVGSAGTYQQEFRFTVSPGVSAFDNPGSLAAIFERRKVTQFFSWASSAQDSGKGRVVGYRSREEPKICEFAG